MIIFIHIFGAHVQEFLLDVHLGVELHPRSSCQEKSDRRSPRTQCLGLTICLFEDYWNKSKALNTC